MEAIQALALAFAGATGLGTAVGMYLLNRLKSLEAESESNRKEDQQEKDNKIAELKSEIADLKVQADKVPDLEKQITTVCTQLEDVQKRLAKAEQSNAIKDEKIATLEKQNVDLFEANKTLSTLVTTYERVFSLMTKPAELPDKLTETPEPGETKSEEDQKPQEA